jgi:hypothetical protein
MRDIVFLHSPNLDLSPHLDFSGGRQWETQITEDLDLPLNSIPNHFEEARR